MVTIGTSLETRIATRDDHEAVVALYDAAIRQMTGTPLDIDWRWEFHPTRDRLLASIDEQSMLVALDTGHIVGALVLNQSYHGEYEAACWPSGIAMADALVIHLLVVDPARPRQGIGRTLMVAAAQRARALGAKAVRLDVFPYNTPAVELYLSLGYADCGQCVPYGGDDHADLQLYELVL